MPGGKSLLQENYIFVEEPSDDFYCPVLKVLLLMPHLTACCGKHLSEKAAKRLINDKAQCPLCKKELTTVLDKNFRNQVLELPVFCPNRNHGCGWVTELSNLESHVEVCRKVSSDLYKQQELGNVSSLVISMHLFIFM